MAGAPPPPRRRPLLPLRHVHAPTGPTGPAGPAGPPTDSTVCWANAGVARQRHGGQQRPGRRWAGAQWSAGYVIRLSRPRYVLPAHDDAVDRPPPHSPSHHPVHPYQPYHSFTPTLSTHITHTTHLPITLFTHITHITHLHTTTCMQAWSPSCPGATPPPPPAHPTTPKPTPTPTHARRRQPPRRPCPATSQR